MAGGTTAIFSYDAPYCAVHQGGRHEKNFGGALCSDDDVTKAMTSLLPLFPGKILGGGRAPLAPLVATPLNKLELCFFLQLGPNT